MAERRKNPGFTLLELVLVMLILAVCAAVAAPMLKGFTRSRLLPNTAQELVTTARWCRVQAISEGVTYRLNLDPSASTWSVTKDDGTTGLVFVPVVSKLIEPEVTLPEGITMSTEIPPVDDEIYISFSPGGRSDVGVIHLMSDSLQVDITCDTPMASYRVVKSGEVIAQ